MGTLISLFAGQIRAGLYDRFFADSLYNEITFNGSISRSIVSHAKPLLSLLILGIGWEVFLIAVLVVALWAILFPPVWLQKWSVIGYHTSIQLVAKLIWLGLGLIFILASAQLFYDNYRASEATGMAQLLAHSTNQFLGHIDNTASRLDLLSGGRLTLSTILGVAMAERSGIAYTRHLSQVLEESDEAGQLVQRLQKLDSRFGGQIGNRDALKDLIGVLQAAQKGHLLVLFKELRVSSREFVISPSSSSSPSSSVDHPHSSTLNRFEGITEGWSIYLLEWIRYWIILFYAAIIVVVTVGSFVGFVRRSHGLVRDTSSIILVVMIGFWQLYLAHLLAATMIGSMCGSFEGHGTTMPMRFSNDGGSLNSQSMRKMWTGCRAGGHFAETFSSSLRDTSTAYQMSESVRVEAGGKSIQVQVNSNGSTWSFDPHNPQSFNANARRAVTRHLETRRQDYAVATNGAQAMVAQFVASQRNIKTEAVEEVISKLLDRIRRLKRSIREDPVPKNSLVNNLVKAYIGRLERSLIQLHYHLAKLRETKPQLEQLNTQTNLRSIQDVSEHFTSAWNASRLIGDDCQITGHLLWSVYDSICHTVSPGYDGVALMLLVMSLCTLVLCYLAFTNGKYRGVSREVVQERYGSSGGGVKDDEEYMKRELE